MFPTRSWPLETQLMLYLKYLTYIFRSQKWHQQIVTTSAPEGPYSRCQSVLARVLICRVRLRQAFFAGHLLNKQFSRGDRRLRQRSRRAKSAGPTALCGAERPCGRPKTCGKETATQLTCERATGHVPRVLRPHRLARGFVTGWLFVSVRGGGRRGEWRRGRENGWG